MRTDRSNYTFLFVMVTAIAACSADKRPQLTPLNATSATIESSATSASTSGPASSFTNTSSAVASHTSSTSSAISSPTPSASSDQGHSSDTSAGAVSSAAGDSSASDGGTEASKAEASATHVAGTGGSGGSSAHADSSAAGTQPTSCVSPRPHAPGRTTVQVQHDGRQRSYVLHVPSGYNGRDRLPLVFDIHGYSSFATEQLDRSKWDEMADRETFIVVAPDGVDKAWNAGGLGNANIDDVGFIRSLLDGVESELCIDATRVYATGHSNGGAMTHKLGCQAADLFAAIAPISGWTSGECKPSRPIAVAAVRSLEDGTVRYNGGGVAPSAAADLEVWLAANQCADMPLVAGHGDTCTTHTECEDGTQVMECHPHGDHNFFYATDNLLVPDTIWPFFAQFALR